MEQVHKDKLREFVARSSGSKGEGLLTEMNMLMVPVRAQLGVPHNCAVQCGGGPPPKQGRMGVSCHHVAELIKSIHALGFDPCKSTCFWSRCCQAPQGAIQFNDRMAISNGRLPSRCMWWPFAVLHNTRFTYQYGVQVAPLWCCQ